MIHRVIFVLVLLVSVFGLSSNPVSEAAPLGGSGVWMETWDTTAVSYCADARYYVTPRNEEFVKNDRANGNVVEIDYPSTNGIDLVMARASNGNLVYAETSSAWIHVVEAVPSGPDAYRVTSTFWRTDGSCVISNLAWWTYQGATIECTAWAFQTGNLRSGPGTEYSVIGTIYNNQSLRVMDQAYAVNGILWYYLANGTWVSSRVVTATGNCNFY